MSFIRWACVKFTKLHSIAGLFPRVLWWDSSRRCTLIMWNCNKTTRQLRAFTRFFHVQAFWTALQLKRDWSWIFIVGIRENRWPRTLFFFPPERARVNAQLVARICPWLALFIHSGTRREKLSLSQRGEELALNIQCEATLLNWSLDRVLIWFTQELPTKVKRAAQSSARVRFFRCLFCFANVRCYSECWRPLCRYSLRLGAYFFYYHYCWSAVWLDLIWFVWCLLTLHLHWAVLRLICGFPQVKEFEQLFPVSFQWFDFLHRWRSWQKSLTYFV